MFEEYKTIINTLRQTIEGYERVRENKPPYVYMGEEILEALRNNAPDEDFPALEKHIPNDDFPSGYSVFGVPVLIVLDAKRHLRAA